MKISTPRTPRTSFYFITHRVTRSYGIRKYTLQGQNVSFSTHATEEVRPPVHFSPYPTQPWATVYYVVPILFLLGIFAIWHRYAGCKIVRKKSVTKKIGRTMKVGGSPFSPVNEGRTLNETEQAVQLILSQTNISSTNKSFQMINKNKDKESSFSEQTSVETLLTSDGLTFRCGQYNLEFPPDAVSTPVHIQVSVEPSSDLELDGSKLFPIAPILRCEPSGLNFKKYFKVTLQSALSSQLNCDLIKVYILVRQSVKHPMQRESVTRLGCDGCTTFYANHFSDREPMIDSSDVPNVRKSLCSFGFVKIVMEEQREFTWYLLDKYDHSFDKIRSLHSNEDVSVPLFTFSVDMNYSLRLKLTAAGENDVEFNRQLISIEPEIIRDISAKSFKFLLTRSPHSNHTSSIIYYAITKFHAQATNQENMESLVTTEGDFFSIAWSGQHSLNGSQTSIIFGDTVHYHYSDSSETTSSTLSLTNRDSFEGVVENGLAMQSGPSRRQTSPRPFSVHVSSPRELVVDRLATCASHSRSMSTSGTSSCESQVWCSLSSNSLLSPKQNCKAEEFSNATQDDEQLRDTLLSPTSVESSTSRRMI